MSKSVSLAAVKTVRNEGYLTAERVLRGTAKVIEIKLEAEKFKLGSLDTMLMGLERVTKCEGVCEGFVVDAPRGSLGFGYDPIIRPAHEPRTFAELTDDEKHRWSHRGRAARAFLPTLLAYLQGR